ncbi:MAG: hypothetical protein ABW176_02260 [Candidatus Thiodiazotropha endolucinida]
MRFSILLATICIIVAMGSMVAYQQDTNILSLETATAINDERSRLYDNFLSENKNLIKKIVKGPPLIASNYDNSITNLMVEIENYKSEIKQLQSRISNLAISLIKKR